jgi:hypothetical protein
MPPVFRTAAGLMLALGVVLGIAALSRTPYAATGDDAAMLRLSWRVRGERVQECRKLSDAEIEALPPHMRRSEVCEGRVLPYVLSVRVDDREIVHDTIHGAGAREDRPLYVFREIPLRPGSHSVSVDFVRERRAGRSERERKHREKGDRDEHGDYGDEHDALATPARLALDVTTRLDPGAVGLVTYDPDHRALLLRTAGDRP